MARNSLFKSSSLIFKNSGHTLTLSDRSYRCTLDCKGKCDEKKETQINKQHLERNFAHLATKFKIDPKSFGKLYRQMLAEYLPVMIIEAEEKAERQDELLEATVAVIRQDVEAKNKMKKSDEMDFKESFAEQKNAINPMVLFAYLIGTVSIFSKDEREKELGKTLALITKHVHLSDTGKIESIELEKWGWYILNFIDKKYPDYISNLEKSGVVITNKKEAFCSSEPLEAIRYFESQKIELAMSDYKTYFFYNQLTKTQKLIDLTMVADTKNVKNAVLELVEQYEKNPKLEFATYLAVIAGK